jgi:hypothetical protein
MGIVTKDIITNHINKNNNDNNDNNNNENNLKHKNSSYNNEKSKIIIVMITVLETTTAPQLNNILQALERCEVAKGVGQRAA